MVSKSPTPLARRSAKVAITLAAIGLFFVLRLDVACLVRGKARNVYDRRIGSPHIIAAYLRNHPAGKLQLGAGPFSKPGWLNTDIDLREGQAYLDITKPFPLPDGSMHVVFSEHLIEHIHYEDAARMLKECYRVLGPNGRVRIATPNLLKFVALFQYPQSEDAKTYVQQKIAWHLWPQTADPECLILNRQLRYWAHEFVYTPKMLRASLESAGFVEVKEFVPGQSDTAALSGLEARPGSDIKDVNSYETMVLEAVRR